MRKKVITKDLLLETAGNIIKEYNLEACTMREISRQTGIASGTIYNYYTSREALLTDLFEKSWKETGDNLELISNNELPVEQKFIAYCQYLSTEITNRKGLGRALFGDALNIEKLAFNTKNNIFSKMIKAITRILKESPRNVKLNQQEIDMISEWVLILIISIQHCKTVPHDEAFTELCSRFL